MPQRKQREHEAHAERRHREESGDDPRAHAAIVARRWEGSAPPTLERYQHALAQWRALSGTPVPSEQKS